jgi:hypothetical protein
MRRKTKPKEFEDKNQINNNNNKEKKKRSKFLIFIIF